MAFATKTRIELQEETRDEGWWQSVLSDEERFSSAQRPRWVLELEDAPQPQLEPQRQAVSAAEPAAASSASPPIDWGYAETVYKQDQVVTLTVSGYNRGGLLVESASLSGFVPYSHLVEMTCQTDVERENFLAGYVGRELSLKVIECVPGESRVVFSERAARAGAGRRAQLFSHLRPGEIVSGEVTNITDFGVFIDLGGVEGLIHISELSWGRVIHPAHVVQLGQRVEVQVIDILPERCRIALSLKRLQKNPWESVQLRYAVNDIVPATITTVVSYGVFARLEEGLEGLVHVSEMSLGALPVREAYKRGQKVNVRILHIDPAHKRLSLSLKLDGN
jgi:small subunit ribosomal protein S1